MSFKTLEPRLADVGGIPIARLLPNKGKDPIAAWCFLDHAGPAQFADDELGLQVSIHPHTNLQTFTWILEGEVLHRDSLGNEKVITKNKVNLMTAGTGLTQGISHTEQSVFPDTGGSAEAERSLHAVQLWIALPSNQQIERSFHHYPELPAWTENGVQLTLTTGTYRTNDGQTYTAPTLQYSKLVGVDVHFLHDSEVNLTLQSGFEYGILVVVGELEFAGKRYQQDELIRFDEVDITRQDCMQISAQQGTRIMFLGGEPLNQKVLLWWNFVADNKEELEQSIIDWNNQHPRFGTVHSNMKRLVAPPLPEDFKG